MSKLYNSTYLSVAGVWALILLRTGCAGAASAGRWAAVVRVERWPGPPSPAQQPVIAPPRPRQAGDTGTRPAPSVCSQYTSRSHPAKMPSEPRTLHCVDSVDTSQLRGDEFVIVVSGGAARVSGEWSLWRSFTCPRPRISLCYCYNWVRRDSSPSPSISQWCQYHRAVSEISR